MKKAVIITGKLVQDHEFIYPFYRLKEDLYNVDVAVDDGQPVVGQIGSKIIPTIDFNQLLTMEFDIIVLPGGAKCMEYLRQDRRIINYLALQYNRGVIIASICHAAQLLISAKIVAGKKMAGYYSLKDDIENAGAIYVDEPCVVSENIVTTAHYKDMGPWFKGALNLVK